MSTAFPDLSPADQKLLVITFQNLTEMPAADWVKIATAYGYKDANMARGKFNKLKNKIKGGTDKATASDAADEANEDADDEGLGTPTPKPAIVPKPKAPRAPRAPRKRAAAELGDGTAPVAKRGRPSKAAKPKAAKGAEIVGSMDTEVAHTVEGGEPESY